MTPNMPWICFLGPFEVPAIIGNKFLLSPIRNVALYYRNK